MPSFHRKLIVLKVWKPQTWKELNNQLWLRYIWSVRVYYS